MSQELIQNVKNMKLLIQAITVEGKRSEDLIKAKATSAFEYDMKLAVTMAKLKLEGNPTTTVEKLAKGEDEVAKALGNKIVGEESLKAHWKRMENLKAQLNGYQSINRFLDTGV